jgi:hypothetical protein
MTGYIDDSQTAPKTLTLPSNALTNGAGKNSALNTRVPPNFKCYNGGTGSQIGDAAITFNTSANHNVYSLEGTIDIFGNILFTLQF